MSKIIHALLLPWSLSKGIHTWCGHRFDDPEVTNDSVASAPEAINCPRCIESMKKAKENLDFWVPRLRDRCCIMAPEVSNGSSQGEDSSK